MSSLSGIFFEFFICEFVRFFVCPRSVDVSGGVFSRFAQSLHLEDIEFVNNIRMQSRFATTMKLDAEQKLNQLNVKNTKRATKNAANILKEYLREKLQRYNFETFTNKKTKQLAGSILFRPTKKRQT